MTLPVGMRPGQPLWKTVWQVLGTQSWHVANRPTPGDVPAAGDLSTLKRVHRCGQILASRETAQVPTDRWVSSPQWGGGHRRDETQPDEPLKHGALQAARRTGPVVGPRVQEMSSGAGPWGQEAG